MIETRACAECGTTNETYENQFTAQGPPSARVLWCQECNRADGFKSWSRYNTPVRKVRT